MSWFDASGLANIAKSALKGAQKTIDKALDIKEDTNAPPSNIPIDIGSDDFFGAWGVTPQSGEPKTAEMTSNAHTNLWGSFTGSFFDINKKHRDATSVDSLDDSFDVVGKNFEGSKLIVQQGDDRDCPSQMSELESPKKQDKLSVSFANCLSVVSDDGGSKNSSESVEVINCSTTECTSPESDALSNEPSISTPSTDAKQTSESVEVLVETPSSLDLISSESGKIGDDFSPLESSSIEETSLSLYEETAASPDKVEVVLEDQDESVAEDTMSYTSISESTSATVLESAFLHLKPQKMLKDTYNTSMTESDVSLSPDKSHNFVDAITRAPSRSGMHLPLSQNNQLLIDTQPQSSKQDLSDLLKNTNIIDIPPPHEAMGAADIEAYNSEGSQSDKTVVSEEGGVDSMSEARINSVYLKRMLADAMTEKSAEKVDFKQADLKENSDSVQLLDNMSITQLEMPLSSKENSSVSSGSKSDLVKIGSEHTSGDELETATSSDIEIISGPNGDSSSTQSRQSPATQTYLKSNADDRKADNLCKMTIKKVKGHTRELSEASSISDDSHSSEVERLVRRISEMTEILDSRESKLIDMNRKYAELQELNGDLKHQLDVLLTKQLESVNVSQVTEEYTQRLSALEKKFQQAIREKDSLRKQLEHNKQETATRISKSELESLICEKDQIIKELREEGEKLSKQQLQHSNIIKKLRTKEKENESTTRQLKETIEDLSSEMDRLQRSLDAKEEVECSQIEAIYQLTAKNKKLENSLETLQDQFDDLTQKYDTAKKSFDEVKKEIVDRNRANSELIVREQMLESLQNEKRKTESQNATIMDQLEDLRSKVKESDMQSVRREQTLRNENSDLLRRLAEAETRNEELSQTVLEVSKPLVRQLESLQATYNAKVANFEKVEQELTLKINQLQSKLSTVLSSEKVIKEECANLKSDVINLKSELSTISNQNEKFRMQVEQANAEKVITEQEFKREADDLREHLRIEKSKNEELLRDISDRQETVTAHESDLKKMSTSQDSNTILGRMPSRSESNSPTLSLGRISVTESLGSSFWSQQDEPFDVTHAPRYSNMFEIQILQSNLKQREGEVQQLQWELNRRDQERSLLNSEISSLLTRIDDLENKMAEHATLKGKFEELVQQYETLCQLYGEKVEENEELKMDLQDVKEMYKIQIDELLKKQKHTSS